jgi:hypothetical protein
MSDPLAPRLLDPGTIERAYPLVRNLTSGITRDRWGRFARPLVASRSALWPRGLMTIQNAAGYIFGLFSFEVRDDLRANRTLSVENIMIATLPGRDTIWATVVEAVEDLARIHGCRAIRASLNDEFDPGDDGRTWLAGSLEAAGYVRDGVRARKRIGTDDAANGY